MLGCKAPFWAAADTRRTQATLLRSAPLILPAMPAGRLGTARATAPTVRSSTFFPSPNEPVTLLAFLAQILRRFP